MVVLVGLVSIDHDHDPAWRHVLDPPGPSSPVIMQEPGLGTWIDLDFHFGLAADLGAYGIHNMNAESERRADRHAAKFHAQVLTVGSSSAG